MAYLIDGNNFIGSVSRTDPSSGGKEHLVTTLLRLIRVRRSRVLLVFDGPPDPSLSDFDEFRGERLRIFYPPPGSTADDIIQRLVDGHTDRRTLTVVSSDREIKDYARNQGAKVLTCLQFNRTLKEAQRLFREQKADEKEEASLSSLELKHWMALFESHEKKR